MTDLLLKRSRIALKEVYDVVCEGRIVGRIMLANVLALVGPGPWRIGSTKAALQRAAKRLRSKPRSMRSRRAGARNPDAAASIRRKASLSTFVIVQCKVRALPAGVPGFTPNDLAASAGIFLSATQAWGLFVNLRVGPSYPACPTSP